jgi:hypothetical protein
MKLATLILYIALIVGGASLMFSHYSLFGGILTGVGIILLGGRLLNSID